MSITDAQLKATVIVPKFTGVFSMVASGLLIYFGIKEFKKGKSTAMSRAVVGIGCFDFVSSMGWFLSTWMVPPEYGMPLSTGNHATW